MVVGSPVKDPIATLSAGGTVVKVEVPPEKAALLQAGMKAKVRVDSKVTLDATIEGVGQPKKSDLGEATATAVFRFADPAAFKGNLGESVPVEVVLSGTEEAVLAVPSSAIYAGADGAHYLQLLRGSSISRAKVTTGMIGGGLVEVTSEDPDVVEGAKVVVGTKSVAPAPLNGDTEGVG